MDEQAALSLVADTIAHAGDDAAIVDETAFTIDMLHDETDFPDGTTQYTVGWRTVGASLSDLAAMGATADAAVGVYAVPSFEPEALSLFLDGAMEVCELVDAEYVGGDLDHHQELTVATAAIGSVTSPVYRSGAAPGDHVVVTGDLGRSAAAMRMFESDTYRANELFRFHPRVAAGRALGDHASAMLDSSDGLARSVHQLAAASDCGVRLESDCIPISPTLREVLDDSTDLLYEAVTFGEDFELVAAIPPESLSTVQETIEDLTVVGEIVDSGVTLDGEPLPDEGYTHGNHDAE